MHGEQALGLGVAPPHEQVGLGEGTAQGFGAAVGPDREACQLEAGAGAGEGVAQRHPVGGLGRGQGLAVGARLLQADDRGGHVHAGPRGAAVAPGVRVVGPQVDLVGFGAAALLDPQEDLVVVLADAVHGAGARQLHGGTPGPGCQGLPDLVAKES